MTFKFNIMGRLLLALLITTACKGRMLDYPYAENNATKTNYYGVEVSDDYEWLKMNPGKNPKIANWFKKQNELSQHYFKKKSVDLSGYIDQLVAFPRLSLLPSDSEIPYFSGVYPYSQKFDIYRYDGLQSQFIKQINLPFQFYQNFNSLVFNDGRYYALIMKDNSENANLYIYDLQTSGSEPVHIIEHVKDYPLIPRTKNSFFFMQDAFAHNTIESAVNNISVCSLLQDRNSTQTHVDEIYSETGIDTKCTGNIVYDEINQALFLEQRNCGIPDSMFISRISGQSKSPQLVYSLNIPSGENYQLVATDDINLYILSKEHGNKGKVYALNKKSGQLHMIAYNPELYFRNLSLIKGHVIVNFKKQNENKIYVINKHTLEKSEVPVHQDAYYHFYNNPKCDTLYYHKESLVAPKELYKLHISDFKKRYSLMDNRSLPFNPDDYVIENRTFQIESGDSVNLELTYKKGMKRNGSNPLVFFTFINAENFLLDHFSLLRTLYMDYGFIFVQRAASDVRNNFNFQRRTDGIYSSYKFLIDEKYTSSGKVAFVGKELGASALMNLLNKYDMKSPVVMIDGIYDFVDFHNQGKALFKSGMLVNGFDSLTYSKTLNSSPYYNIRMKNYPAMLIIASDRNKVIPADQSVRLTAKLQMRTKGWNPILLLTSKRDNSDEGFDENTYKMYIEKGFSFLANEIGVNFD